ncbi:MAG: NfeD family protein [Acidobacteria bacterium]|jgi:membrane protein implicated in regulation of membrane protease activity|nr:NfeD family protein [Acidobacteriota bacterium]
MEQLTWILWIILGVVLIIAEIFTLGFVLLWFGIGAFVAALAGWLGLGFVWQFLIFAVISIALTAMSRTIFAKYFAQSEEDTVKMGMDALPGQVGTVMISSTGALNEGAVKVYGSTWTAFPIESDMPLIEGEKVEVVRVQGSSIYVQKIEDSKTLPEWREENKK